MKKYTAHNLLYLRENYPNIYQIVRNLDRNRNRYVITNAKSGEANLVLIKENSGKSMSVYSKYSPSVEAERWIQTVVDQIGQAKHLLLYGFGLGYHIETLIQYFPDRIIHIYEPDLQMLLAAIESRDLTGILKHKNIGIFGVGNDEFTINMFLYSLTSYVTDSFATVFVPFYISEFNEDIEKFSTLFQQAVLTVRTNTATRVVFKEEWPKNIIMNLPNLLHGRSLNGTEGIFKDVPAIIVGSGPSLDLDIDELHKLQNRAIIMAAGTSVQALLHRGIRPHLVITIDGSEKNYKAYHDLRLDGIPIVYASFVYREIVKPGKEDQYHIFIKEDTISSYLFELDNPSISFYSTSTVTGISIQLAAHFGCKTIIFMGQDFSYPDGVFYAKGVDHFTNEELKKIRTLTEKVKNVKGGFNPTSKSMQNMLNNTEDVIAYYQNAIQFINTSRCGAEIKGTRHLTFDYLYDEIRFPEISPDMLRSTLREMTRPYDATKKERVVSLTSDCKRQLDELLEHELADIGRHFHDLSQALGSGDERKVEQHLVAINDLWNNITHHKIFNPVLAFVLKGEIQIYTRRIPEIVECNEILKKGELIFKHLGRLVGILIEDARKLTILFDAALKEMSKDIPMAGVSHA